MLDVSELVEKLRTAGAPGTGMKTAAAALEAQAAQLDRLRAACEPLKDAQVWFNHLPSEDATQGITIVSYQTLVGILAALQEAKDTEK
jgi:hypothetical protein